MNLHEHNREPRDSNGNTPEGPRGHAYRWGSNPSVSAKEAPVTSLRRHPHRTRPGSRNAHRPARRRGTVLTALAVAVGSWLLAAVFVRVALDWSDSLPYEGAETEARYIVLATIAGTIAIVGTAVAIILIVRGGGASRR